MNLPIYCPSCQKSLMVSELHCAHCSTTVSGKYKLPVFLQLSAEEQDFLMQFFLSSGSIKEMASQSGISYPTMRNKIDDLIAKIKSLYDVDK